MNVEKHTEREPSQERTLAQKAVRIETDKGVLLGSLVSKDGSICTIEVDGETTEVSEGTYLVRFDQNDLQINKPFNYTFSFDGGETWQNDVSKQLLKSFKAWERASEVVTFSDLIDRTISYESPENIDDEIYKQYPEYDYANEALRYAQENPENAKRFIGFNRNTGWKVHFTPKVECVPGISSYLKDNGYDHKYRYGGQPSDGKAFTIYFGSRQMMEKWVSELERDFSDKLLTARAENEEVVTPHISARFTSVDTDETGTNSFHQYGVFGMSATHSTMAKRAKEGQGYPTGEDALSVAEEAYEALSKRYGSYFHG